MLAVANNRQGHNITLPGDRAKSEFCTSLFQAKRGLLKNATGMREEKRKVARSDLWDIFTGR
jgi:hypothetical protein